MTDDRSHERDETVTRRGLLRRGVAASVGLGVGLHSLSVEADAQEDPGVQYYNFVVPDRGIASPSFVNKFLFALEERERTDSVPFSGCFERTESAVANQFQRGARTYDGVLIDATERFQLFGGDDEAVERLRDLLEGEVNLPEALDENIGAIVGTRIYAPEAAAPLPTNEGYRAVAGERCENDYVRLRVHELPDEVVPSFDRRDSSAIGPDG